MTVWLIVSDGPHHSAAATYYSELLAKRLRKFCFLLTGVGEVVFCFIRRAQSLNFNHYGFLLLFS